MHTHICINEYVLYTCIHVHTCTHAYLLNYTYVHTHTHTHHPYIKCMHALLQAHLTNLVSLHLFLVWRSANSNFPCFLENPTLYSISIDAHDRRLPTSLTLQSEAWLVTAVLSGVDEPSMCREHVRDPVPITS